MQLASDGYEPLLPRQATLRPSEDPKPPRPGGVDNDLGIIDGLALAASHGVALQRSVNASSKRAGLEPRC